ncbi:MAG: hypothetical protein R6V05_14315 [Candidatus Brocadiia bacterium]
MKCDLKQCSVVLAGKWNTAILSPKWVSDEVFDSESIEVLFAVLGDAPPRYQAGAIQMVVGPERVEFIPQEGSEDVFSKIEEAAVFLLRTLEYTPIRAVGENFRYELTLSDDKERFDQVFRLSDGTALAKAGSDEGTDIRHCIGLSDCVLNLTLAHSAAGDHVDLNYHYDVSDAQEAAEKVENTFWEKRSHGLRLLADVYNLNEEEVADEDE